MNEVKDLRKKLNPDNSFAVPNDLADKYMRIFNGKQLEAVMDLIRQTYKAGVSDGRNESPLFAIIPVSILENSELSANAKLLYGEIMALSKRSGKCYATNAHLAKMLSLSDRSIPQLLKELSGIGLVIIDIKRSSKGTYRDIMVSFFNEGGHRSITRGASQYNEGGIVKERGLKRNRQKKLKKDNTIEFFDKFYSAYPRKTQKSVALKSFTKLNPDDKLLKVILDDLTIRKATEDWKKDSGKFIPYPATYLNQTRWEDEDKGSQPEKKPFFRGEPMVEKFGKWKVISDGVWKEFAGSEDDIEWK